MINIELNAILMQKGWERMGKDGKGTRCWNFLCSSFNRQLGLDALVRLQQCFRKKRDELEDINQEMDGAPGQP
jgi:hypothetical protein